MLKRMLDEKRNDCFLPGAKVSLLSLMTKCPKVCSAEVSYHNVFSDAVLFLLLFLNC